MTFFDSVKGTVCTAVDTIANVTQEVVERNRTNAKLNRLRLIMKNESELMNRAYIALGKSFYDSEKKGEKLSAEQQAKLFEVIENSKAKIAKARECYRKIVDSTNDIYYGTSEKTDEYKNEDIVDITVACSNENEYQNSAFPENKLEEQIEQKQSVLDEIPSVETAEETVKDVVSAVAEDEQVVVPDFQPKHIETEENDSNEIYSYKRSEIEQLKERLSALDIDTDEDELF